MPQLGDFAEVSTLDVVDGRRAHAHDLPQVPALTVLFHPDPARIGERARLPQLVAVGGEVLVSRIDPGFAQPHALETRPLSDLSLSRRGLQIRCQQPERWAV